MTLLTKAESCTVFLPAKCGTKKVKKIGILAIKMLLFSE